MKTLLLVTVLVFVGLLAWGEHLQQVDLLETKLKYAHQREGLHWDGYREVLREKKDLEEKFDFCASELERWTR